MNADVGVYLLVSILAFQSVQAQELKKLSMDDASVLGTTIATDARVKSEGKASIKITTRWPTVICLGEISKLNVENATINYRAKVKCEKLEGTAYLEMWCFVGGGQYFSRGLDSVVTTTEDWKSLQTTFLLEKGQKADKAILNIVINGTGTVWVDDVRLSKEVRP